MAFKKVKGTLERVLDKNMQDLVRGIRNHKECEVCVDLIYRWVHTHIRSKLQFYNLQNLLCVDGKAARKLLGLFRKHVWTISKYA